MSGFSNAVVGGVGKLIRKWIQSPDYAQGISGWTVNQDGSAEFNDVTIRGIVVIEGSSGELFAYLGTPGLGTLVCAIAGQSGNDSYGNVYQAGITLPSSLTGNPVGQIAFADSLSNAAVARSPFMADFTVAGVSSDLKIKSATDDIINHQPASIDLMFGIAPNPPWTVAQIIGDRVQLAARNGGNGQIELVGPVQVGAGLPGKYYNEMRDLAGVVIPNATVTQASGTLYDIHSDYGADGQFTGDVWTCPVTGYYDITMATQFTSGAGGPARMAHLMQYTGANSIYGPRLFQNDVQNTFIGDFVTAVSGVRLSMGDTLTPAFYQASTFSKTISNGYIAIARRL